MIILGELQEIGARNFLLDFDFFFLFNLARGYVLIQCNLIKEKVDEKNI
jgi:hypothetical protein